ncbi:SGNH/GDSL hydrolase family protein [Modestobacter sp. SYSU DS0511]
MRRDAHPVRPTVPRAAWVLALLLSAALPACGLASGPGSASPAPGEGAGSPSVTAVSSAPVPSDPATAEPIVVAVVGDSITAGADPQDTAADPGDRSWLPGAAAPPLEFGPGYAVPGITTEQMRDEVTAYDADALVVLAGTNDVQFDVPWERTRENLVQIVETADVGRVLLVAVPPLDSRPADVVALNGRLADLADDRGWAFLDPWVGFATEGSYRPGASADGIHPDPVVAFAVGREIREQLLSGAAG